MPHRRLLEHLRHDLKRIRTKDSFSRNAFAVFSGNTVVLLSQLVLTPVIARIYGPEAYGIYGLFSALVMNLSSFTDLGYSNAYVLPKEDERFVHLLRLNFVLLAVVCLVLLVVAMLHEQLYALLPNWRPLGGYIYLLPVSIATYSLSVFFTQWFTRVRAFNTSVIIGSSATVTLRVFNMGYGLLSKGALHGLIIGDVLVNSLATIAYAWAMLKHGIRNVFRGWSWQGIRELAIAYKRYPLLVFPERWVSLVGLQLPMYLLISDPVVVGHFALAGALLLIPLRLLGYSFSTVYTQKAAEAANSDPALLGRITKGLYDRLFWLGVLPFSAMMFFSDEVFAIILGEAWHDSGVITAYLGLFFFFRLLSEPMIPLFYAQRKEHMVLVFQSVLTVARLAVMLPLLHYGFGSHMAILGYSMVSALAYLVLGYLVLNAVGQQAFRLTLRSLIVTSAACALFALLRFSIVGDWWPS